MPRDGNGLYSKPPGIDGAPNTPISSANWNAFTADVEQVLNGKQPRTLGGTGEDTIMKAVDAFSTVGANIASASTTNIAVATGQSVTITGTNAIEEFGTAAAGVRRFVTFAGILTLTYHATKMILPGLANIVTAAGDTCVAASLGGGNWKVTGFTRAAAAPGGSAASETQAGIVEKATVGEVYAATPNKYLAADHIETASAYVAMTNSAAPDFDWDAGVNRSLTISQATEIQNPTNGQPGTYRSILAQGNNSTERAITFGNQFLGEIPGITDCTSTRWYDITIKCITATHFTVISAHVAKKP